MRITTILILRMWLLGKLDMATHIVALEEYRNVFVLRCLATSELPMA